MDKRKKGSSAGITLTALVVTIVVLLILAGISIITLTGENGIVNQVIKGKDSTKRSQIIEEAKLEVLADIVKNEGKYIYDDELSTIINKFFKEVPQNFEDLTQELITKEGEYKVELSEIIQNINIKHKPKNNEEDNATVVAQESVTINKKSNEDTKTEQLTLPSEIQSGGTWSATNSDIASVDEQGQVTWKSVGKTKVQYIISDEQKVVFDIKCTYSILPITDGWQSINDCGTNGTSSVSGKQSYCGPFNEQNKDAIAAGAIDNEGIYSVTIYRTIDLTNVNSIIYTGYYYRDNSENSQEGFKTGLVDNNNVTADCSYKTGFYIRRDMSIMSEIVRYPIRYNVKELSGNHVLAFTAKHGNCRGYSYRSGYIGEILLTPDEQQTSDIPDEYQRVEYIKGTGSNYINTGLRIKDKYQIEVKFKFENIINNESWLLGDWKSSKGLLIGIYNSDFVFYCGNETAPNIRYSTNADTQVHTVKISKEGVTFDGELVAPTDYDSLAGIEDNNLLLFKSNHNNNDCNKCIYECKIWDADNNLIRDYKPCYKKDDGTVGIYDLVEDRFYEKQGNGDLGKGADI